MNNPIETQQRAADINRNIGEGLKRSVPPRLDPALQDLTDPVVLEKLSAVCDRLVRDQMLFSPVAERYLSPRQRDAGCAWGSEHGPIPEEAWLAKFKHSGLDL